MTMPQSVSSSSAAQSGADGGYASIGGVNFSALNVGGGSNPINNMVIVGGLILALLIWKTNGTTRKRKR